MKRWIDIPGFFDFALLYDNVVEHLACPKNGGILIECGCLNGRSLCYLGEKVKQSGKKWKVIGIDNGLGVSQKADPWYQIGELVKNVYDCGLQDVISILTYDSVRAASLFPDNSIDFVFLDTLHTYTYFSQEIKAWYPKIKINGILAGDDVGLPNEENPVWPDVKKVLDEWFKDEWKHHQHDSWIWTKR